MIDHVFALYVHARIAWYMKLNPNLISVIYMWASAWDHHSGLTLILMYKRA